MQIEELHNLGIKYILHVQLAFSGPPEYCGPPMQLHIWL